MSDGEQWRTTDGGRLKITPTEEPVENILFHDRTNARVEKQMSMLAENAMMHQTMSEMLRGRYEGILKAIRGRVS
jgi:flagellar basal body rod protein FlgB